MLIRSRLRISGALVSVASTLFLLCVFRAGAQTEPEQVARSVVFTEKAAYQRGGRMLLSATKATVVPDPRGRYALIECNEDPPHDTLFGEAAPVVARLLLYDGVTGRVKTVWQQDAADQNEWIGVTVVVEWLPQTDTALAEVADRGEPRQKPEQSDPKSDFSLLLIRASLGSGGVRRLLQGANLMLLQVSPRSPFAMVGEIKDVVNATEGKDSPNAQWYSINEHGTFGPALPLGPHATGGLFWDGDGTTTYFVDDVPTDTTPVANGAASPADKPKLHAQRYAFNVQTQALTSIDKIPKDVKNMARHDPPADGPLRLAKGALSIVPPGGEKAQPPVTPAAIAPLWLMRADNKREGWLPTATLIAPDAQESYLLADNSAVLYVADGAVYAVPLTRQPRPSVDMQYRSFLQMATMSRAKQIGIALIGCAQDYDNKFPSSDSYATTLAPYLRSSDIFNNPATGQPGFTYLLNGDGATATPDTTPMGYLAGPGGRVVLYANGDVVWENAPTPPSSP